jgi:hypothetical protein
MGMPSWAGSRKLAKVLRSRRLRLVVALSIGLSTAFACGGVVETRSGGNSDIVGDASVGGSSRTSGGAGNANSGGARATGGARALGGTSGVPGTGGSETGGTPGTGGIETGGALGPGGASGTGGIEAGGLLGSGGVAGSSALDASSDSESPRTDAADATTTADSSRDASDATIVTTDGGHVDCASSANCPPEFCQRACCPGGYECGICCIPKQCIFFDAAHCPMDRCQLLPTCKGTSVCYPFFSAPPPTPCGGLGYYGGHAPCCSDVVLRCGVVKSDGSCDMTTGGYNGFPECIACGDGRCDTSYENRCSCPEDCP